ncbi:hypothetical protein AU252_00890 [Pseudarthrobacter sulfonivorans]|uniref:ABC transporter domain-containing protein n=1 Tax=Pseudarthrobacter sulfonivorans TaxID=121292 RepID=A0A0U3FLX1_9MICC|nr:ABC transporter ATP-binding protein [Pseudarthrobacter sulfonivorans]ALV39895.1 hypothetical protein AU252_00890 [Pseudarthrobacter sulfonivorans]
MREQIKSHEALAVDRMSAYYGQAVAVRDVSFSVPVGASVGILGPNGAGKTTLLLALAGHLPITGSYSFNGVKRRQHRPSTLRRRGVALVPQTHAVIAEMTIERNLRAAWSTGTKDTSFANAMGEVLELFPALRGRAAELAGNLSGGQRQMLAVGRGLISRPRVLMLDEPTAGLSPKLVNELVEALITLRGSGLTVLLVEQNFSAAQRACDRLHVLRDGTIRWSGAAEDLDRQTAGVLYTGEPNNERK